MMMVTILSIIISCFFITKLTNGTIVTVIHSVTLTAPSLQSSSSRRTSLAWPLVGAVLFFGHASGSLGGSTPQISKLQYSTAAAVIRCHHVGLRNALRVREVQGRLPDVALAKHPSEGLSRFAQFIYCSSHMLAKHQRNCNGKKPASAVLGSP